MLFAFVVGIGLGACSAVQTTNSVSNAVAEGIIAPFQSEDLVHDLNLDLEEVRRGDLERIIDLPVFASFNVTRSLVFEQSGGLYSGPLAGPVGTQVQAGDLLGEQSFEMTEAMEIARYRLVFQIEQFETQYENERRDRMHEIREARTALSNAEANYRDMMRLQLRRLELQLDQFLHEVQLRRTNFQEQLEEIDNLTEQIYAPFDGILTSIRDAEYGTIVAPMTSFFTIAKEDSIMFHVSTLADILRFGNTVMITGDNLAFEAVVVSDSLVTGQTQLMRYSLLPADQDAFYEMLTNNGLELIDLFRTSLSLIVSEVLVHDTLIVPLRAIRQENRAEYVLIYNDGRIMKRYITRGFQVQSYAQILMGVEEGQWVIMP